MTETASLETVSQIEVRICKDQETGAHVVQTRSGSMWEDLSTRHDSVESAAEAVATELVYLAENPELAELG